MKSTLTIIFLFCLQCTYAQNLRYDSLKNLLVSAQDDSARYACLYNLFYEYLWSYPDSSLTYVQQEILLAKKMNSKTSLATAYVAYSWFYVIMGDYIQALRIAQEAKKFAGQSGNFLMVADVYNHFSTIYQDEGDYERALVYSKLSKSVIELHWKSFDKSNMQVSSKPFYEDTAGMYVMILERLAESYEHQNQLDSALKYILIVDDAYEKLNGEKWAAVSYELGNIYLRMGDYATALKHYRSGITLAMEIDNKKDLMDNCNGMANTFRRKGQFDSSIFYANKVLELSKDARYSLGQLDALNLLAGIYKSKNKIDSVAKYLELALAVKDSVFSQQKILQIQNMTFSEQLQEQEQAQQQRELQNKIKLYSSLAILVVFLIIAFILYRSNQHKQKANALLQKQKEKVENTLQELTSMQKQLIQSEKEKLSAQHIKQALELEAKALRAQMNPHFIFNCLNSIKALIQQQEDEKAIIYLSTFSKLIRTIFQNADKREITLFDEIETCRLYTQLEGMRFGKKINYHFQVDSTVDLKSILIPALTIQPFIENAIWHGIMPKDGEGDLIVTVEKKDGVIACIVDDNGIGRETSMQNKFKADTSLHQSKGVRLTQTRLNIDNALNERNATVEIIDKKDEAGKALGTTVTLIFAED